MKKQPHQWTNEAGEVLILKRIPKNRKTRNDFLWPQGQDAPVCCPDFDPKPVCGGGLHGWPWGFGVGEGCDFDFLNDIWLVLATHPKNVVGELENGWKCKVSKCVIRFEGKFAEAFSFLKNGFEACIKQMASSYASNLAASGDDSNLAASGDDSNLAASGNASKLAASGNYSNLAASGNYSKLAASGNYSKLAASGNDSKLAASGNDSICAIAAQNGVVKVGKRGAFALAYYTEKHGWRFVVGKVGEKGIKANVAYTVNSKGKIVRA